MPVVSGSYVDKAYVCTAAMIRAQEVRAVTLSHHNLRLRMPLASSQGEEAGVPCLGQGMGDSLLVLRYEIA